MWDAGFTAGSWNYTETKRLSAGPATASCAAAASCGAIQHEKKPKTSSRFYHKTTSCRDLDSFLCVYVFFPPFFFFDLPPKKGRKVTSACLFRYSFIYICPPLDCSFHTVMHLLANGKIQRGDPLCFSFMISPANIFLHAPETFRLCIKKIWKEKNRLQLALPMLSTRHPAATTCTESARFICHSCCLIGAVGGFTYGVKSCIHTQHRHTHTHTKPRDKGKCTKHSQKTENRFGTSSSIDHHLFICHTSSSSSSMLLPINSIIHIHTAHSEAKKLSLPSAFTHYLQHLLLSLCGRFFLERTACQSVNMWDLFRRSFRFQLRFYLRRFSAFQPDHLRRTAQKAASVEPLLYPFARRSGHNDSSICCRPYRSSQQTSQLLAVYLHQTRQRHQWCTERRSLLPVSQTMEHILDSQFQKGERS